MKIAVVAYGAYSAVYLSYLLEALKEKDKNFDYDLFIYKVDDKEVFKKFHKNSKYKEVEDGFWNPSWEYDLIINNSLWKFAKPSDTKNTKIVFVGHSAMGGSDYDVSMTVAKSAKNTFGIQPKYWNGYLSNDQRETNKKFKDRIFFTNGYLTEVYHGIRKPIVEQEEVLTIFTTHLNQNINAFKPFIDTVPDNVKINIKMHPLFKEKNKSESSINKLKTLVESSEGSIGEWVHKDKRIKLLINEEITEVIDNSKYFLVNPYSSTTYEVINRAMRYGRTVYLGSRSNTEYNGKNITDIAGIPICNSFDKLSKDWFSPTKFVDYKQVVDEYYNILKQITEIKI